MDPRVAELLSIPRISDEMRSVTKAAAKAAAKAAGVNKCSHGAHGPWCGEWRLMEAERDACVEEVQRLRERLDVVTLERDALRVNCNDAFKTVEFERQARWAAERDRDLVLDGLAELREAIGALVGK